ncbi:MAG: NAD-dependent epimerase/dehydratase family protein [Candidatus Methylacidiphilales bacterium]|nr:NAD-dependent epimerase/dehydratase family protein [Candidatus Methylacidiphilales bacterium]
MHVLILGAGYVGRPLADSLQASGHRTTCWVRSEESAEKLRASGHAVVVGDLGDDWVWRGLVDDWDAVVFCASSSGGGPEAYQEIYGKALRLALSRARGAGRFVYTSSTSVYGQDDGSLLTETDPAVSADPKSRVLQDAEESVVAAWGTVLRLSGIYGPSRAIYWTRYVLGGAVPPGDPDRWVNMIHRDDAVSAIRHVLQCPETAGQIYNTTDDEPVRLTDLLAWLRERHPGGMVPMSSSTVAKSRKATSKRISNKKLRDSGWEPLYPTFREGYQGLMANGG